MQRSHIISTALIGLVGGLTFATTASAYDPAKDLDTAKAKCTTAITTRLTALSDLATKVDTAAELTADHHATIGSIISTSTTGLTDLQAKIAADTDPATLKADCEAVGSQFRVFALVTPQVRLAIAGDREAAGLAKGNEVATQLTDAIAAADAAGKDVTHANELLADMQAQLTAASSTLSGVVDAELALTPAQWNADHTVLASATTAIKSTTTDLKAAMADAKAIVAELKA